jgi:hypothetical protein
MDEELTRLGHQLVDDVHEYNTKLDVAVRAIEARAGGHDSRKLSHVRWIGKLFLRELVRLHTEEPPGGSSVEMERVEQAG